jgi:RAB protein geranylgeranyltransferase component A
MMANGALVRVLIHTGVTKYMSFKAVDGSYVFNKGKVESHFIINLQSELHFINIVTIYDACLSIILGSRFTRFLLLIWKLSSLH